MKKYTQEDFNKFERDNYGFIICPTGDYTAIKQFPARCHFGEYSIFGGHSTFGSLCHFDRECSFGEGCNFDQQCYFGDCCNFGEHCTFGRWCGFGERCLFDRECIFGVCCNFGEHCTFGEHCVCEDDYEFKDFFQVNCIGSRCETTQFWLLTDDTILVCCGCFCGALDEFIERVKETHNDNKYAKQYAYAIELAKTKFELNEE